MSAAERPGPAVARVGRIDAGFHESAVPIAVGRGPPRGRLRRRLLLPMIWRNPTAWLGLTALLIPIAIHLLARQRAVSQPFPSLRFIQPSRLAAVRRRAISDWPLLLVRLAILALVVAALADPLWQTAGRRAEWATRRTRAVVVDSTSSTDASSGRPSGVPSRAAGDNAVGVPNGAQTDVQTGVQTEALTGSAAEVARRQIVEREAAGAFRSSTFETTELADGLRRAVEWLSTAPPSRREIVVIADFQVGTLDATMLRDVPAHVGVRFVRTGIMPATRTADGQPRTHRAPDGFALRTPRVTVSAGGTAVTWAEERSHAAPASPVRVSVESTPARIAVHPFNLFLEAREADRRFVLAATQAVLAQGVPLDTAAAPSTPMRSRQASDNRNARPVTIVIAGSADVSPGGTLPNDVARLGAPWMADVLSRIARDQPLVGAVGRASVAAPAQDASSAPSQDPSAALARDRSSAAPSPDASTAPPRDTTARSADDSRVPSTESSAPSATARREASDGSHSIVDLSAPWIVVMRDAQGRPAVLAASDNRRVSAPRGGLMLVSRLAADDEGTTLLVRAAMRAMAGEDGVSEAEVLTLSDATLSQWQRPATDPPAGERRHVESHDRRWLWAVALFLLAFEHLLRRARHQTHAQPEPAYDHAA